MNTTPPPPIPPTTFTLTVTVKDKFTGEHTAKTATFKIKELSWQYP